MDKKNQHLGHLILNCFRTRPDVICQIDASTGATETNASVLSRSIQMANSLRAFGLVPGDVLALSGKNHLDLRIPYYAALFNGLPTIGVDSLFKFDEIKLQLKLACPKIAFCEAEHYEKYARAARELQLSMRVVTYGEGEHSMKSFLLQYQTQEKEEDFQVVELDPTKAYIWLISTSGTTGFAKVTAFTHGVAFVKATAYLRQIKPSDNVSVNKRALNLSPVAWVSGLFNGVGMPLLGQTIVQTSAPATTEHVVDIINKYKPQQTMIGASLVLQILKSGMECDLTCFDSLILGGSKVPPHLISLLKTKVRPDTVVVEMYGQTETMGPPIFPNAKTPVGSCGGPVPLYQIQLADPETGSVITEPYVNGELLVKGLIFTEYYNSPEETEKAFTKDGWYKSGDLLYRDEFDNYYFVERIKTIIKYQNYHVVPKELEDVILNHEGVEDVAVVGIPHPEDGEHAVAFVVRKEGATVTAEGIHELVSDKLSEKKQLRGGIIFIKEIPLTSNMKVSIAKLKEIAANKA